ncbi:Zn-finger nucleic acid-binding protein [Flavobacterium sp. HSC-61S13]|nr:Zn-finger nucleic acid-binding protein [Flavobacterium sp. HSC-61S13]
MHIQIYQCSCCNGLWKRTTFNEIDKWLEVGEVTVAQENYIPFDQYGYYPIEYFTTDEAYYYDNTIYCGNPQETKTIHNLRCTPKTLILLEIIKEENGGCSSIKEEMYQCKKCQTKWLITEEFDTHHGYAKSAKKI